MACVRLPAFCFSSSAFYIIIFIIKCDSTQHKSVLLLATEYVELYRHVGIPDYVMLNIDMSELSFCKQIDTLIAAVAVP